MPIPTIDLPFLSPTNRREDCHEFFGWPYELIDKLFQYSKEYYEGPWENIKHDDKLIDIYYSCGFYCVRQLSYNLDGGNLSMKPGQLTRVWLEEIIKDGGSVLEIGAGAMDTGLFLSKNGIKYTAIEHSGYPQELCKFRAKKYGCDITVLNEKDELPQADHCLCLSVIDHLYNPIEFVERLAQKINKCIWARPNISIDYDRPAHDKRILKDVPQAFQIIDEFNKKNGWSYAR